LGPTETPARHPFSHIKKKSEPRRRPEASPPPVSFHNSAVVREENVEDNTVQPIFASRSFLPGMKSLAGYFFFLVFLCRAGNPSNQRRSPALLRPPAGHFAFPLLSFLRFFRQLKYHPKTSMFLISRSLRTLPIPWSSFSFSFFNPSLWPV